MAKTIYPLKLYVRHRPHFILITLAGLCNLAMWIWLAVNIQPGTDSIFLHYTILVGVDYIGQWWQVFYLPLTGLLIFAVNMALGCLLYNVDRFISYVLLMVNLASQALLLVAAALLVFLNV